MIRLALGSLIVGGSFLLATAANAASVFVPPGPGTPVQDAIDAAAPGDTIRLAIGSYPEHIVITKRLRLRGVTSLAPQYADTTHFEGGCGAGPVITVAADDVQIREVAIGSDAEGAVQVHGRTGIKLKSMFVLSNCDPVTVAAYDVVGSTRVLLDRVWAAGFGLRPVGPAGIRIADSPGGGKVRVRHVISGGYDVGVLLENNGPLSVQVSSNDLNFSTRGIVLQGTTRAMIVHNDLHSNTDVGIEIEAGSSGNVVAGNTIDGSTTDVLDNGAANCWRNNTFTTGTDPGCP